MWRMASRTPAVRQVAPVARRRTCVEWVAAGVPAVLVLGWFWLPGLVVLRVLAFRGLGLVAVAPLVTLGVLDAYDAVVHLNTIRYVQESGSASSLTVSGVYSAGQDTGFYPAAWHGVTALVPAWPDPATVFTIAAFLPTAVAWTTGIAFLTRSVFPGRPRAACCASTC